MDGIENGDAIANRLEIVRFRIPLRIVSGIRVWDRDRERIRVCWRARLGK